MIEMKTHGTENVEADEGDENPGARESMTVKPLLLLGIKVFHKKLTLLPFYHYL